MKTLSGSDIKGSIPSGIEVDGNTYYNRTSNPICLQHGYSTVANGRADAIIVPPHGSIVQTKKGSVYSFAEYTVNE